MHGSNHTAHSFLYCPCVASGPFFASGPCLTLPVPAPALVAAADLFNWATGREGDAKITNLEAMDCARRPQGRSWEVVFDKLMELGEWGFGSGALTGAVEPASSKLVNPVCSRLPWVLL